MSLASPRASSPPRWPVLVGVVGLVVAAAGLLGGLQDFIAPTMHRVHVQILAEADTPHDAMEARAEAPAEAKVPADAVRAFRKISAVPAWFDTWSRLSGTVRLLLAAAYSCAAVLLILRKYAAVPLLLVTASVSLLWSLVRAGVSLRLGEAFAWLTVPHATAGVLVHLAVVSAVVWGMRTPDRGGLE